MGSWVEDVVVRVWGFFLAFFTSFLVSLSKDQDQKAQRKKAHIACTYFYTELEKIRYPCLDVAGRGLRARHAGDQNVGAGPGSCLHVKDHPYIK